MAIESGKYVSQNDPGRGAATIFQYGNTNYDSLFNAMRQKRYDDRAIMESKRKEVNDLISTVQEEVWKYDTEKFQSMMNEFTNDVKETYAKSDKGDYYDVSPIDQIRLRAKLNKINTFADKSMQDKKNSDEAEAILGRNLKNVDMDAFKQHWQTEIGKEPGTRDFINFPWINTKEPEEVKYVKLEVTPQTTSGVSKNEQLNGVETRHKTYFNVTDDNIRSAYFAQTQVTKNDAARRLGMTIEQLETELNKSKIDKNVFGALETLLIDKKGSVSEGVGFNETNKGGGFNMNFGGGAVTDAVSIESNYGTKMTSQGNKRERGIDMLTISLNPKEDGLFKNYEADYTGGYYDTTTGEWVFKDDTGSLVGKKVLMNTPTIEYRNIPNRDMKTNAQGFYMVSENKAVPLTPAVLASVSAKARLTKQQMMDVLVNEYTNNVPNAAGKKYTLKLNAQGFYSIAPIGNTSTTRTQRQGNQTKPTVTAGSPLN